MSLRARILLLVLVATLTPTVVLGLYFLNERDRHIEEAKHSLRALANYAVEDLDDRVKGTVQLLHGLSRAPDIDTTEKAACSEFLAGILAHYPQYTGLITITPDGDLLLRFAALGPQAEREWSRLLQAGAGVLGTRFRHGDRRAYRNCGAAGGLSRARPSGHAQIRAARLAEPFPVRAGLRRGEPLLRVDLESKGNPDGA